MINTASIIIAVDGLAASGKGTIARKLAQEFGFAYLDTGLLYRAVALAVRRSGASLDDPAAAARAAQRLDPAKIMEMSNDPELRVEATSVGSSKVGAVPGVRASLLKFQQDFAKCPPGGLTGAVLDGRDIGTVIAPDAPVKIYVTASPEVRARRRTLELQARGEDVTEAQVLADMRARDERDQTRAIVPAKPAVDAVVLDTSGLTADEAVAEARAIVRRRLKI
ncbi:MAG: (d)CMP kinase [Alphaproteobacteria bacterium]|nr:(d)CMP kinase [Alphaproteobacteria bacterium]